MAWVFPVIGATKWSGGSYMDKHTKGDRSHYAIDIYADRGQQIISPVNGVVTNTGSGALGGNWAQITGADGNVYYFAHMAAPTRLAKGSSIKGGTVVGAVGNSGSAASTSPHLHFSIKSNGVAFNPADMLRAGIIVPSVDSRESEIIGGRPNPRGVMQGQDWGQIATGYDAGTEDDPYYDNPSTVQQVAAYRQENAQNPQENPRKQKASSIIQRSLRGMSDMVTRYGFQTEGAGATGIAEIDRAEDVE